MSVTAPLLPSIVRTSQGLDCCGCSMCYNQETDTPITGIGPHDLHCLCGWCFSTPCTDRQCDEQFAQRYPDHFTFDPDDYDSDVEEFSLTHAQIERILEDTFYHPPSTSPTNHDMHSYNGNHGYLASEMVHPEVTSTYDHTHHNPLNLPAKASQFIYNLKHDYDIYKHQKIDAEAKDFKTKELAKYNFDRKAKNNLKHLEQITEANVPGSEEQKHLLDRWIHEKPREIPAQPDHTPKPDNKTMHIVNGNRRIGPMTLKQFERKERRKIKKKEKKKLKKVEIKQSRPKTIVKSRSPPKAVRAAAKVQTKEQILARRYAAFLKNPVFEPPRLGSTGNIPTKVLQGYWQGVVNTATAANGAGGSDFIAYLSPKMFKTWTTDSNFAAPIFYGFAKDAATNFVTVASTSQAYIADFANYSALAQESGVTTRATDNTTTRWLGGHISVSCKCPMMNVAPPQMFGGLLPSQPSTNGSLANVVDPGKQLNQLNTGQIRSMKSTNDLEGLQASAIYLPSAATDLQFTELITDGSANNLLPNYSIPYVGFTGCPTSGATVTITAVGWFEIMQNNNNMNYSGWRLGPKLSTEDIFDNLPRKIKPYNNHAKSILTKGNSSVSQMLSLQLDKKEKTTQDELLELKRRMEQIQHDYSKLSVHIDEYEDEKYPTTSPPVTPKQAVNLSKSTIDLALALKDRLTPGSVTSKTAKISLP